MSAIASPRASVSTVPQVRGEWFSSAAPGVVPGRPRFGWLHEPAKDAAMGIGLVIVPPFGYEAICAHRSLRHMAESAARAGVVAVRFDLDGTGDSVGDDLEPGRLEAWVASVCDACDWVRANGASRVVIAGVRLGATLAMLGAARRRDVAGVVAIAAVPVGKALVREARALQMALGLEEPPPGAKAEPPDAHEAIGFALTTETRDALSKVDLVASPGPGDKPAAHVLVIDRDDMPGNDKWASAMRARGIEVEQKRLPGYVEMMLDPHRTTVPQQIIDATIAFSASRPPLADAPAASPVNITMRIEPLPTVTEDVVHLDDDLVAIATRGAVPTGRAVILLNSGAIHHVGPNRLYVELARKLAVRGDLVLRLDVSGIGDSRPRGTTDENVVYSTYAVEDVGVAVAWCKRQGARSVAVAGLCSGAYHALKAAVAGQPIDVVVPINPLTFFWKPGMPLDFAAFKDAARYQGAVRSAESWKKLLRGDVDVRRVAKVLATRARQIVQHRARDIARELRLPLVDDLASELAALGRRGTSMRFVFSASDPGRPMLLEQAGKTVERLRKNGKLTLDVVERADHTFTARWAHPMFLELVSRAVTR